MTRKGMRSRWIGGRASIVFHEERRRRAVMRVVTKYMVGATLLVISGTGCMQERVPRPAGGSLIELRLVHDEPADELERVEFELDVLNVEPVALISDEDIEMVRPEVRDGELLLDLTLTASGAERISAVSEENVGRRLALFLGSEVRSAPTIQGALVGRLQVVLEIPEDEAHEIVERILLRWPEV
jgi:hypothetical protein